jgi:hypothetical protein
LWFSKTNYPNTIKRVRGLPSEQLFAWRLGGFGNHLQPPEEKVEKVSGKHSLYKGEQHFISY